MNKAPNQPPPKKSPAIAFALALGVLVIVAAIAYKGFQSNPQPPPPVAPPPTAPLQNTPSPPPIARTAPAQREETAAPVEPSPAPAPAPSVAPQPAAPLADPKDLVSALAALTGKEPITPEQAAQWKASLQQLIRQGSASIPAIQQFLAQNLDANFADINGASALGYNSLRSAMLDALAQIGGPESTETMLQTLQSSIFPSDIATLAKTLDAQAPGQYQQAILDAVRQQLNMGSLDQLGGANVLPLFQTLAGEAANGANVTADLTQYATTWPYYSAIALASLPDGAGVSALTQLAQGTLPGNQAAAAEALAELAPQNTQALNALLDMAKSGQLSDNIMSQLAPFLAGRQFQLGPPPDAGAGGVLTFHMASGNQDFSAFDAGTVTQPQITQSISIIDQLLQAIPSTDPATQDALQAERNALVARQKP